MSSSAIGEQDIFYRLKTEAVFISWRRDITNMIYRPYTIVLALAASTLSGCSKAKPTAQDSAFAAVQERGGMAMGVDQYTSEHKFDITDSGGRIALERDTDDSLGIQQIRTHMKLIQHSFESGDFSAPSFVHQRDMPGTDVMSKKRDVITYTYQDLPRGGAVVIATKDSAARAAIADFLMAQRMDHRSGGMDPSMHSGKK
jgi:hypothetical protein